MKAVQVQCPNCGSSINIQEGMDKSFCQYCGQQIVIEDENKKTTHQIIYENRNINNRYYDEAKIKQLELEHEEKIFLREEKSKQTENKKKMNIILLSVWVLSLLIFIVASFFTLDNVNFSPFHIFIIIDIIAGIIVIKKRTTK